MPFKKPTARIDEKDFHRSDFDLPPGSSLRISMKDDGVHTTRELHDVSAVVMFVPKRGD